MPIGLAGLSSRRSASRNRSANGLKREIGPPMIASINDIPYVAVRITDFGLPPTPIQVGMGPPVVCGTTSASTSGARSRPDQVTGFSSSSRANRSTFSSNSSS
jgi:hypothetical protein